MSTCRRRRPQRRPPAARPPPLKKVRKKSLKPARSSALPRYSKRMPPGKPPAPQRRQRCRRSRRRGCRGPCAAGLLVGLPVGTELVVGLALLGVGEDLVGLADLLEALLGRGVALVDVGMVLAGKATEGLLDVGLTGALVYAEGGVVVAILHRLRLFLGHRRRLLRREHRGLGWRGSWRPSPRPWPWPWSGRASARVACGAGPRPAPGPCSRRGPASSSCAPPRARRAGPSRSSWAGSRSWHPRGGQRGSWT